MVPATGHLHWWSNADRLLWCVYIRVDQQGASPPLPPQWRARSLQG